MGESVLKQEPQQRRARQERDLESAIGQEVRSHRHAQGMTVSELASKTGISMGMLSKIENGNISPSLNTLSQLALALDMPISLLFRRFEDKREAQVVKAGEGREIARPGSPAGHKHFLLGHLPTTRNGVAMEPCQITLDHSSKPFTGLTHDGVEWIHVQEGALRFRHGDDVYDLEAGDSFFFDATAPHGPEELLRIPVRLLSVKGAAQPE